MNNLIKVAIIEDLPEIRNGLGFLIDGTDGYKFAGGFGSGFTAGFAAGAD